MKRCILAALLFITACAPTRFVKPLEQGEHAISFNTGGALIGFGKATIPIPLSALTYGYGFNNTTTFFGSLHTTSLLFGVFQTELGLVKGLRSQNGLWPGISTNWVINTAIDRWEGNFRFWPQIDANAYWEVTPKKHLLYVGLCNWFETRPYRSYDEKPSQYWIVTPQMGFRYTKSKFQYGFETKWIAPNVKNLPNVIDYKGINGNGAIGLYLSVGYKF